MQMTTHNCDPAQFAEDATRWMCWDCGQIWDRHYVAGFFWTCADVDEDVNERYMSGRRPSWLRRVVSHLWKTRASRASLMNEYVFIEDEEEL